MNPSNERYAGRGVSSGKEEVHEAIKNLDKGLYPTAFCKILPDMVTGDAEYCNIIHADTAGTKPSLAYLYWKETGDLSVWKGITQDALVMNFDDMACVGLITDFILSSTIGRNKHHITGDVIKALINGSQEFIEQMAPYGINIHHGGGETADVGDIVRTVDAGYTIFGRMKRADLIVNKIRPGQIIVGFAGYGQAIYESEYNSGIGSNGLTSARHDVLHNSYAVKYPESFDANIPSELVYCGSRQLTDSLTVDGRDYHIGKLLLSPTRTFLPLLQAILKEHRSSIKGLIHNTGGAHTKVINFCDESVQIIKDNLLPVPPIFGLIAEESGGDEKELYKVFNMGTRLEAYLDTEEAAHAVIEISSQLGIAAQIIGRVESSSQTQVTLTTEKGTVLNYQEH